MFKPISSIKELKEHNSTNLLSPDCISLPPGRPMEDVQLPVIRYANGENQNCILPDRLGGPSVQPILAPKQSYYTEAVHFLQGGIVVGVFYHEHSPNPTLYYRQPGPKRLWKEWSTTDSEKHRTVC